MKVLALLAPGFEDLEALGTIALLRRGNLEVDMCSVDNTEHVVGKFGIKVKADVIINKINTFEYDALFLPGGMPGVDNLFKVNKVSELVRYFVGNKKILACICAAPSVPGRLGLLSKRNFTCYPGVEKVVTDGIYQNKSVIVDDFIITARAAGSVYEFAYEIIKKLTDEDNARRVWKDIYYCKQDN